MSSEGSGNKMVRRFKVLGLAAFATLAAMAFIGATSASAVTLCEEPEETCGSPYEGKTTIKAALKSGTKAVLNSSLGKVECAKSNSEGITDSTSGSPLTGDITELKFTECFLGATACTVTTINLPYEAALTHTAGTLNGIMTVTKPGDGAPGAEVECGALIDCTFTADGIELNANGGNPGQIVASNETLTIGAIGICPTFATWTATYDVSTPNPVYVSK
jgi:hypothetical protein